MLDRENIDTAVGSGAVDTQFWALVCADDELFEAEFEALVSEAIETPLRPARSTSTSAAPAPGPHSQRWTTLSTRPWRTGTQPGRRWQRERGPPHFARIPCG